MAQQVLDDLLATLDVQLLALAQCEVQRGWRLVFPASEAVLVHYALFGEGVLRVGAADYAFAPGKLLITPKEVPQSLAPEEPAREQVVAPDAIFRLNDGLLSFVAGQRGDLVVACGAISASYGGGLGFFDLLSEPLVEDLGDRTWGTAPPWGRCSTSFGGPPSGPAR